MSNPQHTISIELANTDVITIKANKTNAVLALKAITKDFYYQSIRMRAYHEGQVIAMVAKIDGQMNWYCIPNLEPEARPSQHLQSLINENFERVKSQELEEAKQQQAHAAQEALDFMNDSMNAANRDKNGDTFAAGGTSAIDFMRQTETKTDVIHPSVTPDRILEMVEADDNEGLCLACGEEAYGVEPDARAYECEACGAKRVYGAPELLMMGYAG